MPTSTNFTISETIPSQVPSSSRASLISTRTNLRLALSLFTHLSLETVQRDLLNGSITSLNKDSHRAAVLASLFGTCPWFRECQRSTVHAPLNLTPEGFTPNLFQDYTDRLTPEPPDSVRDFLRGYVESIKLGGLRNRRTEVNYWCAIAQLQVADPHPGGEQQGGIDADILIYDLRLTAVHHRVGAAQVYLERCRMIPGLNLFVPVLSSLLGIVSWVVAFIVPSMVRRRHMLLVEPRFVAVRYRFDSVVFERMKPGVVEHLRLLNAEGEVEI